MEFTGYPDGTFQPDNAVSRAEAVVIVNKITGRDNAAVYTAMYFFTDVPPEHWAYEEIRRGALDGEKEE